MNDFRYGAVIKVQREYALEKVFSMLDKMKAIGMNTVVIWPAVYWWEDKNSPNYPYQTGHEILRYAEKIDMKVVMELAGQIPCLEYVPNFLEKDEFFATKEDGSRNHVNSYYGYYNFNHPEVKQLLKKNYQEIASNYKGYSSLFGYDIWNETTFTSYDNYTIELFRKWLSEKYGSIENLNDSWDRTFSDWSQVAYTKWLWASIMPKIDWEQFRKANIGIILSYMKECIYAVDDSHPVIADNLYSVVTLDHVYERAQDDWTAAANTDIYGMDIYPKFGNLVLPDFVRWQSFTGAHSATRTGKFWVSELQTHHGLMFDPPSYVFPSEIRQWCWEAISHGAKGVIYWKWDPFNRGKQTYGRGLVDFKGEYTPRALGAGEVADIITENEREFSEYMPGQPGVAILFEQLAYDFVRTLSSDLIFSDMKNSIYIESMMGLYKCLWEQNIAAKFITDCDVISNNVSSYKAIFISNHINISPQLADALSNYVKQGGVVVADGKFGEINNTGMVYEQIPGEGLHSLTGFEILDMRPDNLKMTFDDSVQREIPPMEGLQERRELLLSNDSVGVWARYCDKSPAIVHSKYGEGDFIYISTMLWYGYLRTAQAPIREFLSFLNSKYSLSSFKISDNALKVCTLDGSDGVLVFAFNYSGSDCGASLELKVNGDGKYQVTDLYIKESTTAVANDGRLTIDIAAKTKDVSIYKVKKIEE